MTVQERKAELRRHAAGLPQVEAGALFERFLALPQVKEADVVMVFYGTGREPDTVPLIRALLERGKRVALPVVLPHRGMEARQVLELIHGWQERLYPEHGLHFIHASDEWYILAGEELPEEESYDGYLQLENGVGMLRLLLNEFAEALDEEEGDREERRLSLATGLLAAPYLERMAEQLREKFPRTEVMVCPVKNEFFGEQITVSGLITGQDLVKQLSGKDLAERLLLPCNMLRAEEDVFLDDFTVSQVQSALQVPLNIVKSSGQDLLDAILARNPDAERP